MKPICIAAIAVAILSLLNTAHALPAAPRACPGVAAIQASHLWLERDRSHYTAFQDDQAYDTHDPYLWNFFIWDIDAKSIDEADPKANAAMAEMSLNEGPFKGGLTWVCTYNIGNGYTAKAYYPPL